LRVDGVRVEGLAAAACCAEHALRQQLQRVRDVLLQWAIMFLVDDDLVAFLQVRVTCDV